MTPYTKTEDFAETLSDSLSRFQPFYHGVFNPDNILNGPPQNSHRSFIAHTLHRLLNSIMEPAREFMVSVRDFWEFAQITYETSIDFKSTALEVLRGKFQCELERLSIATAFSIRLLMNLDGACPTDVTPVVTGLLSLIRNDYMLREDILGIMVHL